MNKLINKLTLGTVQFGLNYGISNVSGQPSEKSVFRILEYAYEKGIRKFDTGSAYGTSEKILGNFIKSHGLEKEIKIISKYLNTESKCKTSDIFEKELENSLAKLNVKKLYGYLFHRANDLYESFDLIKQVKNQNLVDNIGVSIYKSFDAIKSVSEYDIDHIQIPFNLFDKRLIKNKFFQKTNKVKVFARSPFLQGLLLMNCDDIPKHLNGIKKYIKDFESIVKKHNFTKLEASFLYSFSSPNIYSVVFGVETLEQLIEIFAILNKFDDFNDCFKELNANFFEIDEKLISPDLWEGLK